MTTRQKMEALFRQITELPDTERSELLQALIDMHAEDLGIYSLSDDERAELAPASADPAWLHS